MKEMKKEMEGRKEGRKKLKNECKNEKRKERKNSKHCDLSFLFLFLKQFHKLCSLLFRSEILQH